MAPKRATRSTRVPPVTPAPTTTTVTEAQLQALIDQGVAATMVEAEASMVRNGYNSNGSGPRPAQTARECSYSEFLKCKPLDFKGTEGVVGLTRWFEKMESVFSISNCPTTSQVKFATCTLQDDALTWSGLYQNPAAARNQRTHACYECGSLRHFKSECPIVKFQKCVDKKISTLAERQAENKRKLNNTSNNNQNQQQPNKRQNTGKAYTTGHGEKKHYGGSKLLRPTNDNTTNNQRGTGTSQKVNCYECGNQGHYKRDCPERKNQSHKNQIGGTGAHGVVHTLRGEETDQDPNNTKDEIKA
ncbi:putative reverse transcriptase domain-containing protein [Tanacetum coccineum]